MAYFMDQHVGFELPVPNAEAAEEAHARDLAVQDKYGVRFVSGWYDVASGTTNCLAEAASAREMMGTHLEAHGEPGRPFRIIEVSAEDVERFIGGTRRSLTGLAISDDGLNIASAFRAILFTDIERSVELTQSRGDVRAMDVMHAHDTVVRRALAAHHGREVKHTGDGIMGSFASAANAVAAAMDAQRAFASADGALRVRIGISCGEPVCENGDLFGTAVQMAARLCNHAEPTRILVSPAVRELCRGAGLPFTSRGEVALKGFSEPELVYEVRWADRLGG